MAKRRKILKTGDLEGYLKHWGRKIRDMKGELRYPDGALNIEAIKYAITELEKIKDEMGNLIRWHREPSHVHPLGTN